MSKRLPVAILLMMLFAYAYVNMYAPPPGDELSMTTAPPTSGVPSGSSGPAAAGPGALSAGVPSMGRPPAIDAPSEAVPFSGERFRAQFETRGAGLGWLDLAEYATSTESEESKRLLGTVDERVFGFLLRDHEQRYGLDQVNWTVSKDSAGDGRSRLVFRHVTGDGLAFTRTITASPQPYAFDLSVSVTNEGSHTGGTLSLVLRGPHGVSDADYRSIGSQPPTAIALVDEGSGASELVKWSGDDLLDGAPRRIAESERLLATGAMTNYFASVLVPHQGTYVSDVYPAVVLDRMKLEEAVDAQNPTDETQREWMRGQLVGDHMTNASVELLLQVSRPALGETVNFDFTVFSGPKSDDLEAAFPFLEPVIEDAYGSMSWINYTLLGILRFFQGLTGNWGAAIILLTLLVKALLFPLSRIQQGSMARYSAIMQKLKPELDVLKEKHKNNKQKFQQEQMKLLREHGATPPLGGCLLMIPQIFIWISLFQVLKSSIELRHADFMWWITDLSAPDRMPFGLFGVETINLLPILMAAAMVFQMLFSPQTAAVDEQQKQTQKVMAVLMPIMMLVFLYGYMSGLALYIFTSSLLGIFEFRVIRKFWPPPTAATVKVKPKPSLAARAAAAKGRGRR